MQLSFRDVIQENQHTDSEEKLAQLRKGEPLLIYEREVRRKDGTTFPVEINVELVQDKDGKPTHIQSLMRDITERKTYQQTLEKLSYRLQLATEAGGIGVWEWDVRADELIWDDQMYRLYGLNQKEHPDSLYEIWEKELIHPDDLVRVQLENAVFATTGDTFDSTFRVILPNDSIRHIRARAVMLRDNDGQPLRAIGINWDVTDEKQAADALRVALRQEKNLSDLKSRFISMASHEFRTPLATISATTETIQVYRDRLSPQQLEQRLEKILTQVDAMEAIMEDVLQVAKAQSNAVDFKPSGGDLHVFCEDIVDDFRSQHNNHNRIAYTCDVDELYCTFDTRLMRHIISNLISNALKYSPDETSVQVELTKHAEKITLTVADEGIGIPEDDLIHLFEPFHRARNVGTVSGTGLGLVIVQDAVQMHGGHIKVESVVEAGTTFTVTLPMTA